MTINRARHLDAKASPRRKRGVSHWRRLRHLVGYDMRQLAAWALPEPRTVHAIGRAAVNGNKAVGGPERAAMGRLTAAAPVRTRTIHRHLVLVHTPGWQSAADFQAIARHARDIDPALEVFVVRSDIPNSYSRRKAAARPTLVFSPGRLTSFRPLRGKVCQGGPTPRLEQLRRLEAADVPVPRTVL